MLQALHYDVNSNGEKKYKKKKKFSFQTKNTNQLLFLMNYRF